MAVKPLTQWFPPSGFGSVQTQTGILFQDNLGKLLIDNLGNNLIPTPNYTIGKPKTVWTPTSYS